MAAHLHMDQTHVHVAVATYREDVLHVYNIAIHDSDACMCMCEGTYIWGAICVKNPHYTDDSIPTQMIRFQMKTRICEDDSTWKRESVEMKPNLRRRFQVH